MSTAGRVRNRETGLVLKTTLRGKRKGTYEAVRLYPGDGTKFAIDVHRLVALAFIPNPRGWPEVNHLDCDHFNNNVDNLEWTTRALNEAHKYFMRASEVFAMVGSDDE